VAEADTIAAVATASGRGAIGMIRVSGPAVPQIAQSMLGKLPAARVARLADFLDAEGDALDRGLALYFPAPDSFTGEHLLELHGHGGAVVLDLVLTRLLELGCRLARPGEFSERAFLNGKIDIAQAEAVADLIDAGSAQAARAAVRSMQGEFSAQIHALQAQITGLRTLVEAAIDFPDEELDFVPGSELGSRMAEIFMAFEAIIGAARQGALLREGLNVVIAGRPNAGKSSLLNQLTGHETAIVTDQPGTTRDVLRQQVHLDGMPVTFIDTAGLRKADDVVEAEGVRRALAEVERADRVLYVLDATAPADESGASALAAEIKALPPAVAVTLIFNKIDLRGVPPSADESRDPPQIFLSAKTGAGLELLRAHLKNSASYRGGDSGALSARRRHLDALDRARASVLQAADTLSKTRAFELFAEDLRRAQQALGEITGEFSSDDLLGQIFSSFCIGK
jgi:tRNA modification GTPase